MIREKRSTHFMVFWKNRLLQLEYYFHFSVCFHVYMTEMTSRMIPLFFNNRFLVRNNTPVATESLNVLVLSDNSPTCSAVVRFRLFQILISADINI